MKPFARDPFTLMGFHRVLIGTAVAAAIFYGSWELYRNFGTHPAGAALRASIAWALAILMLVYLVRIRRSK
jgi:hypothetical protein